MPKTDQGIGSAIAFQPYVKKQPNNLLKHTNIPIRSWKKTAQIYG